MGSSNLADQLLEVLLEARVERIYGVVGDSLNPLVDAVHRFPTRSARSWLTPAAR
jgi:pyruvate dehydrogenase (quinone)